MASVSIVPGDHNPGTAGALGAYAGDDATNQPGQYPSSLFGVALPQGTGAAGTEGASPGNRLTDSTGEPGQDPATEPISGVTLGGTGAPGSQGAVEGNEGSTTITFSPPGFYKSESQGVQPTITTTDSISGPNDWTATPQGAPTTHPISGTSISNDTGAGQGRVMRGGRAVG
ncbi:MAG TPA: hypothetical protein VF506_22570 [Streptosporangiaceae bacterium]